MISQVQFYLFYVQLAEAVYEYGRGNDEHALQLLGLDFNACDYKVFCNLSFNFGIHLLRILSTV